MYFKIIVLLGLALFLANSCNQQASEIENQKLRVSQMEG
jgi:hypothetical protein